MTNPSRPEKDWIKDELEYALIEWDGVPLNEKVSEFIVFWVMNRESSLRRQIESARKMLDNSLVFIDCACPNDGHYKACYVPRLVTKITKFLEENPK